MIIKPVLQQRQMMWNPDDVELHADRHTHPPNTRPMYIMDISMYRLSF